MSDLPTGSGSFDDFVLSSSIRRAVAEAGFVSPTPIQEAAIPKVLAGHDLLATAQTGTGKTAAFTLPLIERLSKGRARARMPRALVLEPVRELAMQVQEHIDLFTTHLNLTSALFIGGVNIGPQTARLESGVDVLIATPGRLLDLFERGRLLLFGIEVLVIDEADRMLDMGFIPDIETIVSKLPGKRQTLMLSATMPTEISRIAKDFLRNPERVSVAPVSTPTELVEQSIVYCSPSEKEDVLRSLIREEKVENAIIFCNRKRDVKTLHSSLRRGRVPTAALHGDMGQADRLATMENFRSGQVRLLVATDVAGRGLDIQGISHIFNFDVPRQAEDYVHHIGRTGRAGRTGHAVTIATRADEEYVSAIEKLIRFQIPEHGKAGSKGKPDSAGVGNGRAKSRSDAEERETVERPPPARRRQPRAPSEGNRSTSERQSTRRRSVPASTSSSSRDEKRGRTEEGRRQRTRAGDRVDASRRQTRTVRERSPRAGSSPSTARRTDRRSGHTSFEKSGQVPDFLKGPSSPED